MHIIFRVDASLKIGTGHVVRCLTLGKILKENGARVSFICRAHKGHLIDKIRANGFYVFVLEFSTKTKVNNRLSHSHWLGTTQHQDAQDCTNVLEKTKIDLLVVDHYGIDKEWQQAFKSCYDKLMVIDDLADRQHQCDILLDQNLFDNMSIRYLDKVPKQCVKLLGAQYALLHPEYAELRKKLMPRTLPIKRLLIFFGGVDCHNITGLTLDALNESPTLFEVIDVVLSTQSLYYDVIKRQAAQSLNINLHSDLPTLAPLMAKADLSIGAGGSTIWERFCLGLPSMVITLADNQVSVSHDLQQMGLIKLMGDVETITKDQIRIMLKNVLVEDNIKSWSKKCMNACFGKGAILVAHEMQKIMEKRT